jgi:hypothetical protein
LHAVRAEAVEIHDLGTAGIIRESPRVGLDNALTPRSRKTGGIHESAFNSGEQWEVLRREEGAVIVGKDGAEKQLPLDHARKFSVFEREKITLAIGDPIRFTKNVKNRRQKFLNNELRTARRERAFVAGPPK